MSICRGRWAPGLIGECGGIYVCTRLGHRVSRVSPGIRSGKKPEELCPQGRRGKLQSRTLPERPMVEFQEDGSLLCVHLAIIQPQEQCLTHDRNSTAIPEGREGGREGGQEKGPAEKGLLPTSVPNPAPVRRPGGFATRRQNLHEGISILTTGNPQKEVRRHPKCA